MQNLKRQTVAYSIFETYLRQLLAGLAQLGVVLVAARNLGVEQTGNLVLVLLLPKVLAVILNFGTGSANVYYIASGKVKPEVAWAYSRDLTAAVSLVGLSSAAFLISCKPGYFLAEVQDLSLAISLVSFPFILTVSAVASIFQASEDFQSFNWIILFQPVLAVLGACTLWAFGAVNLNQLLIAVTISHIISGVGALLALRRRVQLLGRPKGVRCYARQAIRYGSKTQVANILTFLNYRVDIFLVSAITEPSFTGLYAIAIRAAEQLWLIAQAFATVVLPYFSKLHMLSSKGHNVVRNIARLVFWITLVGAILQGMYVEPFITLLFGAEFLEAATTLRILLVGVVALSASQILFSDLAARNHAGLNLAFAAIILIVNVVANLLLIPEFGIDGAAAATSGAFVFGLFVRLWGHSVLNRTIWWSPLLPHWSEIKAFKATWWRLGR